MPILDFLCAVTWVSGRGRRRSPEADGQVDRFTQLQRTRFGIAQAQAHRFGLIEGCRCTQWKKTGTRVFSAGCVRIESCDLMHSHRRPSKSFSSLYICDSTQGSCPEDLVRFGEFANLRNVTTDTRFYPLLSLLSRALSFCASPFPRLSAFASFARAFPLPACRPPPLSHSSEWTRSSE